MEDKSPLYIQEVTITNYKCFKGSHSFSFMRDEKNWSQWNIFLGNNNTGKTNLLKAIAGFQPIIHHTNDNEEEVLYGPLGFYREISSFEETILAIKTIPRTNNRDDDFYYTPGMAFLNSNISLPLFSIYAYGVVRNIEKKGISNKNDQKPELNGDNLFNNSNLINFEDWLFQLDYAAKNESSIPENREKAKNKRDLLKELITSEIFPEIEDMRFVSDEFANNYIEFKTPDGWFPLNSLGFGYQSTLAWMVDFCKKLFDKYPDSPNPLKEPAVLLVDEIDLHLHPQWQRSLVKYLSNIFTQTQFIVTTHSPFIIQSMEEVNLYTLIREGDHTKVTHLGNRSFVGWRIEEILSEVMGLEDNIQTDIYQELMKQFNEALYEENYEKGKEAYTKLKEIIHPASEERKLLDIQFSQLLPND